MRPGGLIHASILHFPALSLFDAAPSPRRSSPRLLVAEAWCIRRTFSALGQSESLGQWSIARPVPHCSRPSPISSLDGSGLRPRR